MPDDTKSKDTQNYIVRTKRGYRIFVIDSKGGIASEVEVTKEAEIKRIKKAIAARKKTGRELSDLLRNRGIIICGADKPTHVLTE
jgi:hypothetical protein